MQSTVTSNPSKTNWMPYLGLVFGIAGGASAALLIRFAQAEGIPSLLIAAARMALASLLMLPIALRHADAIRRLTRRQLALMAVAGFWLAVHFSAFILSLEYTSVLVSQVLVMTSPLWVAVLEFVFLSSRPNRLTLGGMFLAIGGGVIIAAGSAGDAGLGENPLLGALLAIFGASAIAIYLLIGRQIRPHLSLVPYVCLVYGWGGFFAAIFMLVSGTPATGHSTEGYFWVLMVALFPQMIGHNGMNYALRFFPATYVSIMVQLIVVLAALLAFFVLDEVPTWLQILGSTVLLGGVILASLGQQKQAAQPSSEKPK